MNRSLAGAGVGPRTRPGLPSPRPLPADAGLAVVEEGTHERAVIGRRLTFAVEVDSTTTGRCGGDISSVTV